MYGVGISSSVTVFMPSFVKIGDFDRKWGTNTHTHTRLNTW